MTGTGDIAEDESIYERERREREIERERNYVSRADPRDKGRALDYGDDDGPSSRPGSIRKRRDSDVSAGGRRDPKVSLSPSSLLVYVKLTSISDFAALLQMLHLEKNRRLSRVEAKRAKSRRFRSAP